MDKKQQKKSVESQCDRSSDERAYRSFARKMASKVALNDKSEKVDVLIDSLKDSEYYNKL